MTMPPRPKPEPFVTLGTVRVRPERVDALVELGATGTRLFIGDVTYDVDVAIENVARILAGRPPRRVTP